MYAQKVEGESWIGEKIDPGKIEKMSGELIYLSFYFPLTTSLFSNEGKIIEVDANVMFWE